MNKMNIKILNINISKNLIVIAKVKVKYHTKIKINN